MNIIMSSEAESAAGENKSLIKKQGFTLIEILVVIGIIAVLALIVLVAINPARQFALSRNTQRTSNVNAILNAVGQRLADNKGQFKGTFTINSIVYTCPDITALTVGIAYKITNAVAVTNVDLGCLTPTYIPTLPFDPSATGAAWTSNSNYDTEYTLAIDVNQRVTVCAPTLEASVGNSEICIIR